MRAAVLYLSLCSLIWAQSEFQPHLSKDKQKCVKEHQITIKGPHSKHGFFIFNYVYSSSVPHNQTEIKKEDNTQNISSTTQGDKKTEPRRPIDNLTDKAEETSDPQKHLFETGNDRKLEDKRTAASSQNLNIHQHRLEYTVDNEIATGDMILETDGSGDIDFPGQVDTRPDIITGHELNGQDKGQQVTEGIDNNILWGKDKDGKSGTSSQSKPTKDVYIKIGVKENEASEIHEINPYAHVPKKVKDPQSKDYSKVVLKLTTDSTDKEPGREEDAYTGVLRNGKKHSMIARSHGHLHLQNNLPGDVLGKTEHIMKGNYTSVSGTGIKAVNEKDTSNTAVHHQGKEEYSVIDKELDRQKGRDGTVKSHKKGDVGNVFISGSHLEIAGAIKRGKKDRGKKDITEGKPKSQVETAGVSKTRTEEGDVAVTGRLAGDLEDPIYTKETKRNRSGVLLSVKLNSRVDGFGVTKSKPKGDVTFLKIISGSQVPGASEVPQGRRGMSEVTMAQRKSKTGKKEFGFTSEVASPEIINGKAHESSLAKPKTGKGGKTKEINKKEKGNMIDRSQATGPAEDDKRRNSTGYSNRKSEHQGQNSIQLNSALSFPQGLHTNIQHVRNIPKNDKLKNPGHYSSAAKSSKKVIMPSKKTAKAHIGTEGGNIAKQYDRHFGFLRRKSSLHDGKRQSVKVVHRSDSSQSSESEENSRNDSSQSREDYQNDRPDSYPSAESAEDRSTGRNKSYDHSQMEDDKTSSQEDSLEHKDTAEMP